MSKLIIFLWLPFVFFSCKAQETNVVLQKSRTNAEIIFDTTVDNDNSSLLFSIADSLYIVVVDEGSHYLEKIIELREGSLLKILSEEKVAKPNDNLAKSFDIQRYHKEFISFDSDFYKEGYEISQGSKTYFVMRDMNGNRYGEAILSILIKPNPIDKNLYGYLGGKLINFSRPKK